MKLEFKGTTLLVTREQGDPKYYGVINAKGESNLLHAIKNQLNKEGYNLIKKRMGKDGHLVDDMQQYLRTRKKGAGKAAGKPDIYILNDAWAIEGADVAYNKGEVELEVIYDVFK